MWLRHCGNSRLQSFLELRRVEIGFLVVDLCNRKPLYRILCLVPRHDVAVSIGLLRLKNHDLWPLTLVHTWAELAHKLTEVCAVLTIGDRCILISSHFREAQVLRVAVRKCVSMSKCGCFEPGGGDRLVVEQYNSDML
jgi:hypothetical protein